MPFNSGRPLSANSWPNIHERNCFMDIRLLNSSARSSRYRFLAAGSLVVFMAITVMRVDAQQLESRMGAVAWAIRQRPVSHPRSSNRTCRSPASGSPTGFTARHTAVQSMAGVRGAAGRVLHRPPHRRTVGSRALPLCAVWRGSRARARRRIGRRHGTPTDASRRQK